MAGVTVYLAGVAVYLRATGRVRPTRSLARIALDRGWKRTKRLAGRLSGRPTQGPLAEFVPVEGACWRAELPWFLHGEPTDREGGSTLALLEDGRPLGPGASSHAEVAAQGGGRFSHWDRWVFLSTSDGTDPRTNGRAYAWRLP